MKFGIVGYGRFGKLWSEALLPFGEVMVYDKKENSPIIKNNVRIASLHEVAQANVIFIIVPISNFEESCLEIKTHLTQNTLIVDCCSVKIHPMHTMLKVFSKQQPIIGTHPLFGPDSVRKNGGIIGHKIVICDIRRRANSELELIFKKMGLKIIKTTPEEHDKQMANSQGLVHFIGRGLSHLSMQQQELSTPDFETLLNINNMVINDSWQLFLDMHRHNPYTKTLRQKFVKQLLKIDEEINCDNH